jgi:hypothetical protein
VVKIERIEADGQEANIKVHVRWYYRAEEYIGGWGQFHGSEEVFLSDHYDMQSADTIEGNIFSAHSFHNCRDRD